MTTISAAHGHFTIERILKAPPSSVFAAWSSKEAKAQWFAGPPDQALSSSREMDFRVGGRERLTTEWKSGLVSAFDCEYRDIIANERIIYCYGMKLNGKAISVSLATIQFQAHGAGTKLIVTEQGVFIDGYDDNGSRERGTNGLMDNLVRVVDGRII